MGENYDSAAEGVHQFLTDLGLEKYYEMFLTKGFDTESDMENIDLGDLDCMGISEDYHRNLLLTAAQHYTASEEYRLYTWLRENRLEYYYVNFVRSELISFEDLGKLLLPDESLYDELEIVLPGHKKRLEKAVSKLKRQRRLDSTAESPLAIGRWGKPAALTDAKYDFLCVEALISSTKQNGHSTKMDFMVDSGSDVVTLREEVLEKLDLELLGTVRSKGVHASREKQLYRAYLSIGRTSIEIEVMPESYDSLGSRVIRHFRHFIDGNKHIWLSGNCTETMVNTPSDLSIEISPSLPECPSTEKQTRPSETVDINSENFTSDISNLASVETEQSPSNADKNVLIHQPVSKDCEDIVNGPLYAGNAETRDGANLGRIAIEPFNSQQPKATRDAKPDGPKQRNISVPETENASISSNDTLDTNENVAQNFRANEFQCNTDSQALGKPLQTAKSPVLVLNHNRQASELSEIESTSSSTENCTDSSDSKTINRSTTSCSPSPNQTVQTLSRYCPRLDIDPGVGKRCSSNKEYQPCVKEWNEQNISNFRCNSQKVIRLDNLCNPSPCSNCLSDLSSDSNCICDSPAGSISICDSPTDSNCDSPDRSNCFCDSPNSLVQENSKIPGKRRSLKRRGSDNNNDDLPGVYSKRLCGISVR